MKQAKTPKRWLPVRDGEWPLVLATGTFAFLAVAFAIALRTWCDAVFLTTFDASWIPWLFVASALVFVPATFCYAWLAPRIGALWLKDLPRIKWTRFKQRRSFSHTRLAIDIPK